MRVLITGGGSLLLGTTARTLVARGDEVVCLQRRRTSLPDDVHQVLGDVRDLASVEQAMVGCDAVIHGAARVGVHGSWEAFRSVNVLGTENVVAAARTQQVARIVHISTPSVAHGGHALVGAGATPPVLGRNGGFYAESKALAEHVALRANTADLAVVAVRPHLVWGPGDTQLVGRIVARAAAGRLVLVGGGVALVEGTYIDDASNALIAALDSCQPGAVCGGQAYVVAGGEPRTVRELVAGICNAAGVEFAPKSLPYGVAVRIGALVETLWPSVSTQEPPITRFLAEQLGTAHWFDPRPTRDDLGWVPRISVDEGLRRLAEWFNEQRLSH